MSSERHSGPEPAPRGWARVRLVRGSSPGEIWDVTSDDPGVRLDVGSHPSCSWPIDAPGVAGYQLVFFWDGEILWASDLHGSGGVRVDGEPLADWRALTGRVRIELGQAALIVETSAAAIYDEARGQQEATSPEVGSPPSYMLGGTGEHPMPEAPTRVVHSGEAPPRQVADPTRVVQGGEQPPEGHAPTRVASPGAAVFGGAAGDADVPSDADATRMVEAPPAPPGAGPGGEGDVAPEATRMAGAPGASGPFAQRAPMPQAGAGAERVDTASHVMPEQRDAAAAPPPPPSAPSAPSGQPPPPPAPSAPVPGAPPAGSPPPPPAASGSPAAPGSPQGAPSPWNASGADASGGGPPAPPQGAPPQGAPPQGAPPQGAPPAQGTPGAQGVPPQGAPPAQGASRFAAPPAEAQAPPAESKKDKAKKLLSKGEQSLPMRTWILLAATVAAFVFLILMDDEGGQQQAAAPEQAVAAKGEPAAEASDDDGDEAGDEAKDEQAAGGEGSKDEGSAEPGSDAEDEAAAAESEPQRRRGRRGRDEPETTPERDAVDLLMAGHHQRALEAYVKLAEAHPEREELAAIVDILRDRLGSRCEDGVDEMGRPCEPVEQDEASGEEDGE